MAKRRRALLCDSTLRQAAGCLCLLASRSFDQKIYHIPKRQVSPRVAGSAPPHVAGAAFGPWEGCASHKVTEGLWAWCGASGCVASLVLSGDLPACFNALRSVKQKELCAVCAEGCLAEMLGSFAIKICIFRHRNTKEILWRRRRRKTWRRGETFLRLVKFISYSFPSVSPLSNYAQSYTTSHTQISQTAELFVAKWWPVSSSSRGFRYAA